MQLLLPPQLALPPWPLLSWTALALLAWPLLAFLAARLEEWRRWQLLWALPSPPAPSLAFGHAPGALQGVRSTGRAHAQAAAAPDVPRQPTRDAAAPSRDCCASSCRVRAARVPRRATVFLTTQSPMVLAEWTRRYGSVFRLRFLTKPAVIVTDPALVRAVLQVR